MTAIDVSPRPRAARDHPAASTVLMIRPRHFRPNEHTQDDNEFQPPGGDRQPEDLRRMAAQEIDRAIRRLTDAGVRIIAFDDQDLETPDSVFPNNWISATDDGAVVIYPLRSPLRRLERRDDIVEALRARFEVGEVVDYSAFEAEGRFLEGTGSLVLDPLQAVVFAAVSQRTDPALVRRFATRFSRQAVIFETCGASGAPVYHTNVLLSVGRSLSLVALEAIVPPDRGRVRDQLTSPGRPLLPIDLPQMADFLGNALELRGPTGPLLVMSERARASLRPDQLKRLEGWVEIVALEIPTIELSGGSARCLLAEIGLAPRRGPSRSDPDVVL